MEAELQTVRDMVSGATLSEDARHTINWCLEQLAPLYEQFLQSYNQRYNDEIRRLIQGMVNNLAKETLAESITGQFRAIHERLGLPALVFNPPKKQPRKKKTS
jgi:hypothetical protein